MQWYRYPEAWLLILQDYLPRLLLCSLLWEIAQLPLYTLWAEDNSLQILFAVLHCTTGDGMIGVIVLCIALTINRAKKPALWPRSKIALIMVILALFYTVLSELRNLSKGNWVYSPWMPVLPGLEIGLAPLIQWIIVPLLAWYWVNRKTLRQ